MVHDLGSVLQTLGAWGSLQWVPDDSTSATPAMRTWETVVWNPLKPSGGSDDDGDNLPTYARLQYIEAVDSSSGDRTPSSVVILSQSGRTVAQLIVSTFAATTTSAVFSPAGLDKCMPAA